MSNRQPAPSMGRGEKIAKTLHITTPQMRRQKKEQEEFAKTGLMLGDIETNRNTSRFFLCLIRAFLIFLASFGTVGALVSAFNMKYIHILVIPLIMLISIMTAFLYYNRFNFYGGYFGLLFIFTISIFSLYWYVNSGYQAFSNTVFERYSDYFKLLSIREGTEYITNRLLTVSVAMIFVAFLLCILLNITISGYMSLPETFLITFPLLQIALYIDAKPAMPYLAMLLSVYITVGLLGRSGEYKVPSLRDNKKLFFQFKKKNKVYHTCSSDGPGMLTIGLYSIALSSIFLLITSGLFFADFGNGTTQNKLKQTTDQYVKSFVQTGFWGLFDRYESVGGMNNGRIGGVSSVRPDYQTDLRVTFVPYTNETIYLKSYVGAYYSGNYFGPSDPKHQDRDDTSYLHTYPGLADLLHDNGTYARMDIANIDGGKGNYFMPYDTFAISRPDRDIISRNNAADAYEVSPGVIEAFRTKSDVSSDLEEGTVEYTAFYVPYKGQMVYEPEPDADPDYEEYVYKNYLSVPEFLVPTLEEICEDAGLYERRENFRNASADVYGSEELKEQAMRLGIADTLDLYFYNNYHYTMAPGATPPNKDAIEYFLTVQKRGFCVHFASSSALLLRQMGIPTRYVEGYVIPLSAINDAEAVSLETRDWFIGDNALAGSGLVSVDITDGEAHAWVEIYLDGYGWIPYEFTPPSEEEDAAMNLDFMSIFSGLLLTGNNANNNAKEDTGTDVTNPAQQYSFHFSDSFGFLLKPLVILLAVIFAVFMVLYLKERLVLYFLFQRSLGKQDYNLAAEYDWKRFLGWYYRKNKKTKPNQTPEVLLEEIRTRIDLDGPKEGLAPKDLEFLCGSLQEACFSETRMPAEKFNQLHEILTNLKKLLA